MKPTEIIEKSKIIATWMGWEYRSKHTHGTTYVKPKALTGEAETEYIKVEKEQPHGWYEPHTWYKHKRYENSYRGKTTDELAFYTKWDKLMEVISRIENCLDERGVLVNTEIGSDTALIDQVWVRLDDTHEERKILMVFDAVSQFCEQELAKPKEERYKQAPPIVTKTVQGNTTSYVSKPQPHGTADSV